jgi:hypothetical protein
MAAWLCAAAGAQAAAPARRLSVEEGKFSMAVPKGWAAQRDEAEDRRQKVYGAVLIGPRGEGRVASKISVDFYAEGNAVAADAEAFLKRSREGGVVTPLGETTGPVLPARLAGVPAKRFTRRTVQTVPPDSMSGRDVTIVQEYVVAASTAGFYVATFTAPEALHASHGRAFRAVLKSLTLRP